MVRFLDVPGGLGPLAPPAYLTPHERVALEHAPKLATPAHSPGTTVTVWAKPVHETHDQADHMWVEFDDGRNQFIARGGPDAHGPGLAASALFNDLSVMGQVDPASRSPDFGQGRRVLDRGFLPRVSAEAAAAGARRHAAGVNRRGNPYGAEHNSNSFAADVFEGLFGRRAGDARTWGSQSRLTEDPKVDLRDLPTAMSFTAY